MQEPEKLLRRNEAAHYVRRRWNVPCSPATLAKLASVGGGPVFCRINNYWPAYAEKDLDIWAQSRISGPLTRAADLPVSQTAAHVRPAPERATA